MPKAVLYTQKNPNKYVNRFSVATENTCNCGGMKGMGRIRKTIETICFATGK